MAARPSAAAPAPSAPAHDAPAAEPASAREAATRRRIVEAATDCFAQFGNDKTSLADVALLAGLSRQTVYRYFENRDALLRAVAVHETREMQRDAELFAAEASGVEDFVARLAARQAAIVIRYHTRQHLLGQDQSLFASLALSHHVVVANFRAVLAGPLHAAAARGELRPGLDLDEVAEWIAIMLASISRLTEAATFDLDDPESTGRFIARHACRGLTA